MEKERLTDYIKLLLSQLDAISSDTIDKETVKTMLLSIVGEMYTCNLKVTSDVWLSAMDRTQIRVRFVEPRC